MILIEKAWKEHNGIKVESVLWERSPHSHLVQVWVTNPDGNLRLLWEKKFRKEVYAWNYHRIAVKEAIAAIDSLPGLVR